MAEPFVSKFGGIPKQETPKPFVSKFGGIPANAPVPTPAPLDAAATTTSNNPNDESFLNRIIAPFKNVWNASDQSKNPLPQADKDVLAKFQADQKAANSPSAIVKNVLQQAKPLSIPAALSVSAATPGGPLVKTLSGAAAYTGLYTAIQKAAGETPSFSDAAKDLAINETLNQVGSAVASKAKAFYKSVMGGVKPDPLLDQLGATGAQRTGSVPARFVEKTFAGSDADQQLVNSGRSAKQLGDQTAANLAGATPETIADPTKRAALVKQNLADNYRKSQLTSNTLGNVARMRSTLHPEDVTTGYTPSEIVGPNGEANYNPITTKVEGPIPVANIYDWAQKTLDKMPDPSILVSSDDKSAYKLAKDIVNKTAVYDEKGNQIATRPLSFGDAWNIKQEVDKEYGNRSVEGLADSFNKDIETGISQWKDPTTGKATGDQLALKAFQESKKEVQRRINTFNDPKTISALLNSKNDEDAMAATNALIRNPKDIEKYLTTQSGGGNANQRKLLQGNDLANVLDKGFNTATGNFDKDALTTAWLDPKLAASRKLIYGDEGAKNVSKVLDAIKTVSDAGSMQGQTATKFRVANGAISLAGGLLSGVTIYGGHQLMGAAIAGAYLPAKYLAKASIDKETAPLIAALIKGSPLGKSQNLAMRIILNKFVGAPIKLKMQDGTERDGEVSKDGNITLTGGSN